MAPLVSQGPLGRRRHRDGFALRGGGTLPRGWGSGSRWVGVVQKTEANASWFGGWVKRSRWPGGLFSKKLPSHSLLEVEQKCRVDEEALRSLGHFSLKHCKDFRCFHTISYLYFLGKQAFTSFYAAFFLENPSPVFVSQILFVGPTKPKTSR